MEFQSHSEVHWTPLEVGLKVLEFLGPDRKTRLLDVGSGCGKFCILAALSGEGYFTGVEQRHNLYQAAVNTAEKLGLQRRVTFIHGNMEELDWSYYNAFYLFNPFYELITTQPLIDRTIRPSTQTFYHYVSAVKNKMKMLKSGTRLITYHGFGAEPPHGWYCLRREKIHSDEVVLYIKA